MSKHNSVPDELIFPFPENYDNPAQVFYVYNIQSHIVMNLTYE